MKMQVSWQQGVIQLPRPRFGYPLGTWVRICGYDLRSVAELLRRDADGRNNNLLILVVHKSHIGISVGDHILGYLINDLHARLVNVSERGVVAVEIIPSGSPAASGPAFPPLTAGNDRREYE